MTLRNVGILGRVKQKFLAPMTVSADGVIYGALQTGAYAYYGINGNVVKSLWRSLFWVIKDKLPLITNIHALDSGAFLVGTYDGKVYRIDEVTEEITQVLQYPSGWMHIFSAHSYGQKVVLGEYGARGLARRVYFSEDDGKTFTLIYTISDDPDFHVHAVHYDKYTDQIWFTHGDYHDQSIYVASPPYDNFTKVYNDQPTSIIATPNYVLFGKDFGAGSPIGNQNGILRYNRNTSVWDRVLLLEGDYNYWCPSMVYDEENDMVYMGTYVGAGTLTGTEKLGIWRSSEPYTEWTKLVEIASVDGYRGFLKLAGIYKNELFCWVPGASPNVDNAPLFYSLQLGPLLRTKNLLRN